MTADDFAEFARGLEPGGWEFWQLISAYGIWSEGEGRTVMEPEEILRAMDQLGYPRYHLGFVVRRSPKRPSARIARPESVLS